MMVPAEPLLTTSYIFPCQIYPKTAKHPLLNKLLYPRFPDPKTGGPFTPPEVGTQNIEAVCRKFQLTPEVL